MGVFQAIKDVVSASAGTIGALGDGTAGDAEELKDKLNSVYKVDNTNWFKALPYCFQFTDKDGAYYRFYLPISPSNITVTTSFATNVITTLYATVEEHSEVRYYDMIIEGTTGMAPQYFDIIGHPSMEEASGRDSFPIYEPLLGGFFAKTEALVNQTLNAAKDLMNVFTGENNNPTGVFPSRSGYAAFHNFYRFLLQYKKEAAGEDRTEALKKHPLSFLNYKDGVQYDCAIQRFVLRRSADSPMLYQYSIQMRCYNLRDIASTPDAAQLDVMKNLGLDGVNNSSIMNKIKNASSAAKGVVGGLTGGLSVLGS